MQTPADALAACLRLMDRGAPHPHDADLWHDTRREASKVLAKQVERPKPIIAYRSDGIMLVAFVVLAIIVSIVALVQWVWSW